MNKIRLPQLIIFALLVIIVGGCATGSSVVVGTARPAIDPQMVKLYLEKPKQYDVIGLVEASSDSGWTDQDSQDYAVAELKKQAAKIGANGVLLTATGTETSGMAGGYATGSLWIVPVSAKVVKGTAIFVNE